MYVIDGLLGHVTQAHVIEPQRVHMRAGSHYLGSKNQIDERCKSLGWASATATYLHASHARADLRSHFAGHVGLL
jgi:hypothetical protein